jgi:hypothetical protein
VVPFGIRTLDRELHAPSRGTNTAIAAAVYMNTAIAAAVYMNTAIAAAVYMN